MREAWEDKSRHQNSLLPIWEGTLKQKKSTHFGLGSDVWRDRLVRLDLQLGVLSYWRINEGQEDLAKSVMSAKFQSDAMGPPKKQFDLNCIRALDSNRDNLDIVILLSASPEKRKVKYALHFRAPTLDDFNRWMFVLGHFGVEHEILGLDVEMRGNLTRAFSLATLNKGQKVDDSRRGCADDTESVHSNAASDSTIESIDDDVLGDLCTALEDISPCNKEWCKKVGLLRREDISRL